jgi:hypothetical protein
MTGTAGGGNECISPHSMQLRPRVSSDIRMVALFVMGRDGGEKVAFKVKFYAPFGP